jgi:uncharacterized membrane-anchored protein YjiN (DUF445 family)
MQQLEVDRRDNLRRMKMLALGLLLAAAVVFVITRLLEKNHPWLGYVRATAEAAMVGAFADWFAVTALFRHPLGLKIPHTAIIPTRKNEIGESLGQFIEENFLSDTAVAEKLQGAHIAARGSAWLSQPEHAQRVTAQVAKGIGGIVEVVSSADVQELMDQAITNRVRSVPMAPLAGRALDVMTESGRHHELLESVLKGVSNLLRDQRETFRSRLASESPWWVPEPIDDKIFDKIFTGVQSFLSDVLADQNHELRRHVDGRLAALVEDLKSSPEMAKRAEELKEEFLHHPAVRTWTASLWTDLKQALIDQSDDPTSVMHQRIAHTLKRTAESVQTDPELQVKVDQWIGSAITYIVQQYRHEVGRLISSTVRTWDPQDTSERFELQIGRDLQFIRINGTIVGGLVGLVIYSVSQILG